jgi:hypothetical protein
MTESEASIDITQHIATATAPSQPKSIFRPLDRYFLGAAFASLTVSVVLWFLVDQASGLFVGMWVPSILALWAGVRATMIHYTMTQN